MDTGAFIVFVMRWKKNEMKVKPSKKGYIPIHTVWYFIVSQDKMQDYLEVVCHLGHSIWLAGVVEIRLIIYQIEKFLMELMCF